MAVDRLPVTPQMIASLRESARLMTTHYSTQIEGNRLTLPQVEEVIAGGGGFPGRERDEREVQNYYKAADEIESLAALKRKLTKKDIQTIHGLAFDGKKRSTPYRDGQNVIRLYFRAETTHPLFAELRGLVVKTTGIVPELRKVLEKVPGIDLAFVFRSVAAGTAKAESDVDVMLIGTAGLRKVSSALRGVSERLGREINPHCLTVEEWRLKKTKKDAFVNRVLSEPKFWLKGGDDELGKLG